MNGPDSRYGRAALVFLVFTVGGLLVGSVILGIAGSAFLTPLIDPQKIADGTMFLYLFFVALAFVALPAIVTGLFASLRFLRRGYFRARYAMLVAFLSSGLVGPAYQFYSGKQPTGHEMVNSMLVAYIAVGPIALLCAFLGQRAVARLRLMPAGGRDAELET